MSLEVLEKFANESGNDELVNAVNGIKESYKANVDRVSFLERDLQKSVEKRESIKNLIRTKLGVEDITEESIDAVLSKKGSNGETEQLSKIIESLKMEKDDISNKFNSTVNSYKLEKQLASLGAFEDTENSKAYDIVLSEINKTASFDENGNVVFKDKEGLTLRNSDGSPVTLGDMYNKIRESNEFSFLFKTRRSKQGSGATTGKANGVSGLKRSQMSHAEKGKFIAEFGQEAYLKLEK